MKYIIIPILKLILVLCMFCGRVIIIPVLLLADLWNWKLYYSENSLDAVMFKGNFSVPYETLFKNYYYKTPLDFILSRKTYRITTIKG